MSNLGLVLDSSFFWFDTKRNSLCRHSFLYIIYFYCYSFRVVYYMVESNSFQTIYIDSFCLELFIEELNSCLFKLCSTSIDRFKICHHHQYYSHLLIPETQYTSFAQLLAYLAYKSPTGSFSFCFSAKVHHKLEVPMPNQIPSK